MIAMGNMSIYLLFLFVMFLFFYFTLQLFVAKKESMEKRLEFYLMKDVQSVKGIQETDMKLKKETFQFFESMKMYNTRLKKKINRRKGSTKVEKFLESAGSSWTPGEYLAFRWMFGGIFGGILYLLTNQYFFILIGFISGFLYPKILLNSKRKKRIKKFNDGLQDMITTIISSMRAGYSFNQALMAVSEESSSPLKEEIEAVLKEMQYGISLEDSLHRLYERMPSKDLDIMIQAILIQRQVGGNLATVLNMIVETIRERQKIQGQIRSLTAQGRMSGAVIGALPFALGGLIYLIQPSYMSTLFTDTIGLILISVSIGSALLGFFLIQKLVKIEV
jgi:tight adherence protein B